MVNTCAVIGCRREYYPGCGISFHRIPADNDLRGLWITAMNLNISVSKNAFVCGLHFKPSDYISEARTKLKPQAVPSILQKIVPERKKGTVPIINKAKVVPSRYSTTTQEIVREETFVEFVDVGSYWEDVEVSSEPPNKKLRKEETSTQTQNITTTPRKIQLRREVKVLKQKVKHCDTKILNLKSVLELLKKKCDNYHELEPVLNNNFLDIHKHLVTHKTGKGVRYDDEMKSFALTICFYSERAYGFLSNYMCLPHPSTLRRVLATFNCNVGFMSEVFNYLKNMAIKTISLKNVALIFDAMSIRTELKYDISSDKYWGYVDYGGIMSEDAETLATEVLIFQIVSYTEKFKCPIAYFFINKISAEVQANLILTAIRFLSDIGITVRSITCDGTVTNLKTYERLGCQFTYPGMVTSFKHPQENSNIHCLTDPGHMLRLSRNILAETNLSSNKGDIKFEYIKTLHEIQEKEGLKFANKLTTRHVNFFKKKMNVRLAAQLMSSSIADEIDFLRCSGNERFLGSEATVEYIRIVDWLFDMFNCKNPFGKDFDSPMRLQNTEVWQNILQESRMYLAGLKINNEDILKHRRKTAALGFILDTYSFSNLAIDLLESGIVNYFLTYKCSQDHIERLFSYIRAAGGHNNNPSALQVKYILRKLLFRNSVTPSINTNCVAEDSEISSELMLSNQRQGPKLEYDKNNEIEQVECLLKLIERTNLTEYKNNILYYISGYIVKNILKNINCPHCILMILTNKQAEEKSYALDVNKQASFTFVDRGGLKYVSKFVYEIIVYTEKKILSLTAETFTKVQKKKIILMIFQYFYDKLHVLIDPPHPVSSINCENRHEIELLKCIVNKYLILRMTSYGKHRTLKILGNKRHKLHKTILFNQV